MRCLLKRNLEIQIRYTNNYSKHILIVITCYKIVQKIYITNRHINKTDLPVLV